MGEREQEGEQEGGGDEARRRREEERQGGRREKGGGGDYKWIFDEGACGVIMSREVGGEGGRCK